MKSAKKQKTGHISEEDMSNLLHRYSAQKVLALLQEVSQSADAKMDWNALVKKTATGITSAREYQMLWRHIAYCEELLEKVDDGAEPLDDESDLEYELEAYPAVSVEASAEAAACVKVLSGSGLPADSKVPSSSTVEAPLTINIPNGQSSKSSLENSLPVAVQGTNITVPVSVQKQPLPQGAVQKQSVPVVAIGEVSEATGSTSTALAPRRKRKPWSEDEDQELIAAVQKCGEGNWANILKGDFKGDRTASQLSQRWAIIRKRQSNLSIGASNSPQLSDAQLAARRAIDMALKDNLLTVGNGAATSSNPGTANSLNEDNAVVNNTPSQPQQSQPNPAGGNPIPSKPGTSSSISNPRAPPQKAPVKPVLNLDSSMMTKVAVAAGARLAKPSDAAVLLKAAQANNAVHIMPKGGTTLIKSSVTSPSNPTLIKSSSVTSPSNPTLIKSSVTSPSNPTPSAHLGSNRTMPFGKPPVRSNLVRPTAPSPTSSVSISHATGSQPVRSTFVRLPVVLPAPSPKASTLSNLPNSSSAPLSQPSQMVTAVGSSSQTIMTSCLPKKVEVKKELKTSEVMKAPPPPRPHPQPQPQPPARPVLLQNSVAKKILPPVSSSAELAASSQYAAMGNSQCSANTEKEKAGKATAVVNVVGHNSADDLKIKDESLGEGKDKEALDEKPEEIASEKQQNLPSSEVGGGGISEVKSETLTGTEKSEQKEQ